MYHAHNSLLAVSNLFCIPVSHLLSALQNEANAYSLLMATREYQLFSTAGVVSHHGYHTYGT